MSQRPVMARCLAPRCLDGVLPKEELLRWAEPDCWSDLGFFLGPSVFICFYGFLSFLFLQVVFFVSCKKKHEKSRNSWWALPEGSDLVGAEGYLKTRNHNGKLRSCRLRFHDLTNPNGGLVREMGPRKFQGNLG